MSFSRRQQPEFQRLWKLAWTAFCESEGEAGLALFADKDAKDAWYRDQMERATGHRSSKDCNPGRDYDRAMAHFEAIAGCDVKWNLKLYGGDAKRMLHAVRKNANACGVDELYLRGVARQMLGTADLPELHTVPPEVLVRITVAMNIFVRRHANADSF